MTRYLVCLLLAGALLALPASGRAAATRTVCASGCDFTSVNAAVTASSAGDGIEVMPGTYDEKVDVTKKLSISGPAGGSRPLIEWAAAGDTTVTIEPDGAGTTLSDLDIRSSGVQSTTLAARGAVSATDLDLTATDTCAVLEGSTPSQLGPGVTATTSPDSFRDCVIAGLIAPDVVTGVTVNAPGGTGVAILNPGTVTDSTVNARYALNLLGGTVRRSTLNGTIDGVVADARGPMPGVISDSVVTADDGAAVFAGSVGVYPVSVKLRNVTAIAGGKDSTGLEAEAQENSSVTPGVIDARNVIARGTAHDVFAQPGDSSGCGSGCSPGRITIGYSNFRTADGVLDTTIGHIQSTDPQLVNPVPGAGQDFHIASASSPLIGAGTPDASDGPSDRDGVAHSDPPAIGAYEYPVSPAGQPSNPPPGPTVSTMTASTSTRPTISRLAETNAVFAVAATSTPLRGRTATAAHRRGTIFSFRLDQPATVTIAIRATAPGRRGCRPRAVPVRGTRRCTPTITFATLTRSGRVGTNRIPFSGRIRRRPLKPGRYKATFTATNSAGSSPVSVLRFTVVRPHGRAAFPASARGAVSAALGRGDERYRVTGLRARNPEQRFDATFSRDGVTIAAGRTSTRIGLVAFGRESAVRGLARVSPRVSASRVDYARAGVDEWWANGPLGLEQGFDIGTPPATGRGPLTLSIALSGNLKPRREGSGLVLKGAGRSLHYGGLIATDAHGRGLRSWLELADGQLLIRVDDRRARYPLRVDPFIQQAELGVSDGAADDGLGVAVAASGDTLVVGAPGRKSGTGVAYVFVRPASGWANAAPVAKLSASDGAANDVFGTSVGISGDTIVVGAPNHAVATPGAEGAAYVFVKPPSGWVDATQTAELIAADGGGGANNLGISVAISGDTIVAGDWDHKVGSNFDQGAAYVFVKPATGWANATETATLTASDGAGTDLFGFAVAVSGDTVLVGAPGHDIGQNADEGEAYVFLGQNAAWTTWREVKLTPTDGGAHDDFGVRAALSGDTAVVASPYHRVGLSNQGAAYVFVKPFPGWFDSGQTAELTASDGVTNDTFGGSVDISGGTIVVGAPLHQVGANQAQGAAYLFAKPPSGWANASQSAELTGSDGATGDMLGDAVAVSGTTAFASAPLRSVGTDANRGAVYVFAGVPAVGIDSPANGATYTLGQSVTASYSCSPTVGAAITSCAGPVTSGIPIDTGTLGAHSFTVTATDSAGEQSTQTVTYSVVTGTSGPGPGLTGAPRISRFSQSHRIWREGTRLATSSRKRGAPVGTTFSFTLDQPARIILTFSKQVLGRTVGGRCVAQTSRNRRGHACRRAVTAGKLTFAAHPGPNKLSFQGRISRTRKLKPGTYTLTIVAINPPGQRSKPQALRFAIVEQRS